MKLYPGEKAIDFQSSDIYGKPFKLSEYLGKKILLGFYRNVNCPFCNMRVHQLLILRHKLEERGLKMVFLFESEARILLDSSFHRGVVPMPLISDPQKSIYHDYGVELSYIKLMKTMLLPETYRVMKEAKKLDLPKEMDKDLSAQLIPADFLINEDFSIAKAHYGAHANDHISLEIIKEFAGL